MVLLYLLVGQYNTLNIWIKSVSINLFGMDIAF